MKKVFKVLDIFLLIIFWLLTIFLIGNIIKLSNIENLVRLIVGIVLFIIFLVIFLVRKKKKVFSRVIVIVLSCAYIFLNYTFYKVYSSLDNITTRVDTKMLYLVTNDNSLEDIRDIDNDKIGIMDSEKSSEFYKMAEGVLDSNNLDNELFEYEDYIEIINALLNEEIKYAFLPKNYESIYNASSQEEKILDFKILHTEEKVTESKKIEKVDTQSLTEPFSILLIGTDVILDSYNADTLMLLTVNPKTLKVTMLSIPRDTYTVIACTGGKHKINASGWYGDECVVDTVAEYLDIDIDYYAKINFLGIVELVDELGGVEVEVPYALCEQNSKRQFGKNIIYVDAGLQTLNGEQALALSRNRHYWTGMCPTKYTSDGERSDITRGKNQQLVIQAIADKLMKVKDLNKFYNILDIVGDNMSTNMYNETILSFYNVAKDILSKLNENSVTDVINVRRLTFKSYSTSIYLSGLQLSMIVNYDESINYISEEMKKNLGLMKTKTIKTFSFDINEIGDDNTGGYNKLSTRLELLPNFVGESLSYAMNYCNSKGLKCEGSSSNLTSKIISQSIANNTDISTIRGKTIVFELEDSIDINKENIVDDSNSNTDDVIDDIISGIIGGEIINGESSDSEISNDDSSTEDSSSSESNSDSLEEENKTKNEEEILDEGQ